MVMLTSKKVLDGRAVVLCRECNDVLPDGVQFCSNCGTPIDQPSASTHAVPATAGLASAIGNKSHNLIMVTILALLAAIATGIIFQDSEAMQVLRAKTGFSQQLAVGPSTFSLPPGGFTSYKFVIPSAASNVVVRGEFHASPVATAIKNRAAVPDDGSVEAYVLGEAAFVVWRNGYSVGSEYDSGLRTQGTINAELPGEPGIYYLVFSNRSSSRTEKTIYADILLSYKSWLPEGLLTLKDRFINWLGL